MKSKHILLGTLISLVIISCFNTQAAANKPIHPPKQIIREKQKKPEIKMRQDTEIPPYVLSNSKNRPQDKKSEKHATDQASKEKHVSWQWGDAQKKLITSSVKKSCVNLMSNGVLHPRDILINGVAGIIEYTVGVAWENRHAAIDYYLLFNG